MSLRGDLEITADRERSVWSIAGQSLTSFLDILLIALAFLVPDQSPLGLGVPLLALGAFSCGISIYLHVRTRRGEIRTLRPTLYLPLPCYVAQIGIALALLDGAAGGLPALAAIVALLTFTAISTAWTLLAIPVFTRARQASSGASGDP